MKGDVPGRHQSAQIIPQQHHLGRFPGKVRAGTTADEAVSSSDLGEKKDLAGSKPEKAAELLADLRAWRKSVDAQMPTPNPNPDPAKAKLSANKLKAMERVGKDNAKGKDKGKDKKPKAGQSEDPAEDDE